MSEYPAVPDAIRKFIGAVSDPVVFEIERGAVRHFAEAIGDLNPKWETQVPPTFLCSLTIAQGLLNLPLENQVVFTRTLNGGNELEYFHPVNIGDVITAQSVLAEASLRPGRMGHMLYLVFEVTYTNQDATTVARARNTIVRY